MSQNLKPLRTCQLKLGCAKRNIILQSSINSLGSLLRQHLNPNFFRVQPGTFWGNICFIYTLLLLPQSRPGVPHELGQCVLQQESGAGSLFWQNTELCPVPQTLVRAQCLWITTSVTGMDLVKFHSCWLEISLSCSEQSQVTPHGRHKGQSPLAGKGAGVGKRHLNCPLHPPYQCHMGDEFCFTGTAMNFRCCIPSMKQFHPLGCCVCSETLKKRKI